MSLNKNLKTRRKQLAILAAVTGIRSDELSVKTGHHNCQCKTVCPDAGCGENHQRCG